MTRRVRLNSAVGDDALVRIRSKPQAQPSAKPAVEGCTNEYYCLDCAHSMGKARRKALLAEPTKRENKPAKKCQCLACSERFPDTRRAFYDDERCYSD